MDWSTLKIPWKWNMIRHRGLYCQIVLPPRFGLCLELKGPKVPNICEAAGWGQQWPRVTSLQPPLPTLKFILISNKDFVYLLKSNWWLVCTEIRSYPITLQVTYIRNFGIFKNTSFILNFFFREIDINYIFLFLQSSRPSNMPVPKHDRMRVAFKTEISALASTADFWTPRWNRNFVMSVPSWDN